MKKIILFIVIILGLMSCSAPVEDSHSSLQEIHNRERIDTYRIRAPDSWIRRDPLPDDSLTDTTKPLCEYIIRDDNGNIRLSIHSFPSESIEERVPPTAQTTRWQRQFDVFFANQSFTSPQSFSGYAGILFKGCGLMKGQKIMILGWAMQLASEHYRNLLNKHMKADITIKAVGPIESMERHQAAINAFARSFELIEEIPSRS